MATGVGGGESVGVTSSGSKNRQKWVDSKAYRGKPLKGLKTKLPQEIPRNLPCQELISGKELGFNRFEVASGDSSSYNLSLQGGNNPGGMSVAGFPRVENRVSISLAYKTKRERHELRKKLEAELTSLRQLVDKLERTSGNLRMLEDEGNHDARKLRRVHSEVGSVGQHENRSVDQLGVVVPECSRSERDNGVDRKRNQKENQFNQGLDRTQHKENVSPSEQTDKSKGMSKKNQESVSRFEMGSILTKAFKHCDLLLFKLMSHNHGWVFNSPVDVKALGLDDYFTIIKHPMDLGTVKTRLTVNWYKSPMEFAEDVRLTFLNAITYNPRENDVHKMAVILLQIFEEVWFGIEAKYMQELRSSEHYEASLSTPTFKKATIPPLQPSLSPAEVTRTLPRSDSMTDAIAVKPLDSSEPMRKPVGAKPMDRSKSMTKPIGAKPMNRSECTINHVGTKPKTTNCTPSGSIPAPKKPKAKDPHKREMTYVEKQKLSTDLQNLPSEKTDTVVQIIQKRNPSLCLNDDEIELDIDNVDTETLWELDRFVMNFKKNLSKINRLAELTQVGGMAEANVPEKEFLFLHEAEEKNASSSPYVQHEQQDVSTSRSIT